MVFSSAFSPPSRFALRRGRPKGLRYFLPPHPPDPPDPPARPALPSDPEHVLHRVPTLLAVYPLRRRQRAPGKRRPIARAMRQSNRFGRPVEADLMRAGNEARARRRDIDRPRKPRLLHRPLEQDRGAGRGILLG